MRRRQEEIGVGGSRHVMTPKKQKIESVWIFISFSKIKNKKILRYFFFS